MMDQVWLCLSAVAAGAVNSIAGGGTLLTFPALESVLGEAALANATSTVALFPGSLAGSWGYRRQLQGCGRWLAWLTIPSLLGGAIGASLVQESTFRHTIPWLILVSAVLFLLQPTLARLFRRHAAILGEPSPRVLAAILLAQLVIGIYGGYFGAGIGILMLSSLSFLGLKDIHQINALKTVLAFCMNVTAAGLFIARGLVRWEYAPAMAAAAILGGYVGARLSLVLPPGIIRWVVIIIGFALAGYYFAKEYHVFV
jgi:uncharacterized membrane protein YfcA